MTSVDVAGADVPPCVSFPMPRANPFDPPAELAGARERDGLERVRLYDGRLAWLVTRYDEVVQVLTDKRFSSSPAAPGYPSPSESRTILLRSEPFALGQVDPPDHTRLRRMFTSMFTVRRMEALRPQVERLVNAHVDRLLALAPPVDLAAELSNRVPTWVIADLLGVPHEDQDFFVERANARVFHTRSAQAAVDAGTDLGEYLEALVARREAEVAASEGPHDTDVTTELVVEQVVPGHLSREEAVVLLRNLLVNGQDTTARMISLGALALLTHPEQKALLLRRPELIGSAVNELLRLFTNAHFQSPRTATEDVEIGGQLIRAGEGVIASIVAANHDPSVFPEPQAFDIERDASRHLAFGSGIHFCLGRALARLELEVTFPILFGRIPDLRLALPVEEVRCTGNDAQALGLYALPVEWDPAR